MDQMGELQRLVSEAEWQHRNAVTYPAAARDAALLRERDLQAMLTTGSPPVRQPWLRSFRALAWWRRATSSHVASAHGEPSVGLRQ